MKNLLAAIAAVLLVFVPSTANAATFLFTAEFRQIFPINFPPADNRFRVEGTLEADLTSSFEPIPGYLASYDVTGATGRFSTSLGQTGAVTGGSGAFTLLLGGVIASDLNFAVDGRTVFNATGNPIVGFGRYEESLGPLTAFTLTPQVGAAVPEPATWAMLIAGFALTGAALRRRRVRVVLA